MPLDALLPKIVKTDKKPLTMKNKTENMKTIVTTAYGSPEVLQLKEIDKPVPKENEILIKIRASSVTAADSMMRKGKPYFGRLLIGITKPKNPVPGTGFAGMVEATGAEVKKFKVGEDVFGEIVLGPGTNCEYVCVPENGVVLHKPSNISFEEAAPVCDGALTSLNFLHHIGNLKKGHKILINGASGSLGSAAVQLARELGAEVTGVCSSSNTKLVRDLGAHHTIDYTQTDFTKQSVQYDIIYDTVGTLSFSDSKNALRENGIFMSPVLSMSLLYHMMISGISGGKKAKFSATGIKPVSELRVLFKELKELLAQGSIRTLMDKKFSLEQITEAHNYVDSGRKRGNIVLMIP